MSGFEGKAYIGAWLLCWRKSIVSGFDFVRR
jgi:hypothetical protein